MALVVSVAYTVTTAPALAQTQPHEDTELPTTPPPLEKANPNNEATSPAPASGSAGSAMLGALFGPIGFALGGFSVLVVTSDNFVWPAPNLYPRAHVVEPPPSGPSE